MTLYIIIIKYHIKEEIKIVIGKEYATLNVSSLTFFENTLGIKYWRLRSGYWGVCRSFLFW